MEIHKISNPSFGAYKSPYISEYLSPYLCHCLCLRLILWVLQFENGNS